jgi:hypothetical protein
MARRNHGAGHLITGRDDMRWLKDVHLPKLSSKYKSAVIYGNDDCPSKIEVYGSANPGLTAKKIVFKRKGSSCRLKRR